jgi:hypothetical protein
MIWCGVGGSTTPLGICEPRVGKAIEQCADRFQIVPQLQPPLPASAGLLSIC